MAFRLIPVFVDTGIFLSFFLRCLSFRFKTVGGGLRAGSSESRSSSSIGWYVCILDFYFYCLSFKVKVVGGGPTCQSLFFACAKKSNQKKAHNLTKIDPEITYSLWVVLSSTSKLCLRKLFSPDLIFRQYLSSPPANIILIPQTFQNTMRLQRTSSVDFFLF